MILFNFRLFEFSVFLQGKALWANLREIGLCKRYVAQRRTAPEACQLAGVSVTGMTLRPFV